MLYLAIVSSGRGAFICRIIWHGASGSSRLLLWTHAHAVVRACEGRADFESDGEHCSVAHLITFVLSAVVLSNLIFLTVSMIVAATSPQASPAEERVRNI